jgi:hypothetical protein
MLVLVLVLVLVLCCLLAVGHFFLHALVRVSFSFVQKDAKDADG